MKDKFDEIKALSTRPIVATFYMTARCNLRCNYCYELGKTTVQDLSPDRITQILDELDRHAIHMEAVFLFGGEPTLCTENSLLLLEKLSRMKESKNTRRVLFTNGMVIPEQLLALIKNQELEVFLSSDGFGLAAKERYGFAFAEKQSIFLHNLQQMHPETSKITISFAVGKHNINTIIHDMDLFFKDYQIRSFKVNVIRKNCFAASLEQLSRERQKGIIWASQNEIELLWDSPSTYGSAYDNLYISQEKISFQPAGQLGTWGNVSW